MLSLCFFVNETATAEIYPLSLHDALPIYLLPREQRAELAPAQRGGPRRLPAECERLVERAHHVVQAPRGVEAALGEDRTSTRLNSSHANISYAVFCLKNKPYSLYHEPNYT